MVLSKEKVEEIIKKIDESIKRKTGQTNLKCPVCTNDNFTVVDGFTNDSLIDTIGGNIILGGRVLPSIPIVCTNCGNTFFLNAKILGLSEEQPKQNIEENKNG
ncbi:MAG: hypothetical protein AABX25_01730 [Nanoarchaeota archaeon]